MAHTREEYVEAARNARERASKAFPGADQDAYLELAEAYRTAAGDITSNEGAWKAELRERTGISEAEAQQEMDAMDAQAAADPIPHSEEFLRGKPLKIHRNLCM
jgi:hypothetical protein